MKESYNPDRIKHVAGQNQRIEDPEKALKMAKDEDFHVSRAQKYEAYLATDPAQREAMPFFDELEKNGVSPEFLRAKGDFMAENRGYLMDYEASVIDMTTEQIAEEKDSIERELSLLHDTHHPYIYKTADSTKMFVKSALDYGIKDEGTMKNITNDQNEWGRIIRLVGKLEILSEEIERRRAFNR